MDSITHFCFGYALARGSGLASDRRMAIGAGIVSLLPDLDLLFIPLLDPIDRFAFHRGPSHALLVGLTIATVIAWPLARLFACSWQRSWGIAALALIGHSFCDALTGYGTAWWWPLSDRRVSLELVFVLDPLVAFPLVTLVTVDLVYIGWRRFGRHGPTVAAQVCLLLIGTYLALGGLGKATTTADFHDHLVERYGIEPDRIHAEPTPLNNQLWYLCAETDDRYHFLYRSIWDGDQWETIQSVPRHQEPLVRRRDHPLVAAMLNLFRGWFTCLPSEKADLLRVVDMRLGHRYGWQDQQAPHEFLYHIGLLDDEPETWQLRRPEAGWDLGRIVVLLDRVAGLDEQTGLPR